MAPSSAIRGATKKQILYESRTCKNLMAEKYDKVRYILFINFFSDVNKIYYSFDEKWYIHTVR